MNAKCIKEEGHCWHPSNFQHAMMNHIDEICCHCGFKKCTNLPFKIDYSGHGEFMPTAQIKL